MSLINLIRTNQVQYESLITITKETTDEEILNSLIKLNCSNRNLTSIPVIPNLKELNCSYNRLTSIPQLDLLEELDCCSNQLKYTSLKDWQNIWKDLETYKQTCNDPCVFLSNSYLINDLRTEIEHYILGY